MTRYYIHNHVPHVFAPHGKKGREICLLCGQPKGTTDIHTIETVSSRGPTYAGKKPSLDWYDGNYE